MGTFPPDRPTTIQSTIPAYQYVQFNDDEHTQAFFDAYNAYVQGYVNYLNTANLPIYTGLSSPLLDWVLTNLYGFPRPGLPSSGIPGKGPYNTYRFNRFELNRATPAVTFAVTATSDDTYKRCATWRFYKGDGVVFNISWLKRRIVRFLTGANGTSPTIDNTYPISIVATAPSDYTITIAPSTEATIFSAAVEAGILELPFQNTWTVVT